MRDVARQAVLVTVYGSIIAGLARIFGVERSVLWVALIAFGAGWFAHGLWGALFSPASSGLPAKNPYRAPKAPLEEENDKTLRVPTPAYGQNLSTEEKRP